MSEFSTQLRDKWFLIVFITMLILWYGTVNSRLNSVEAQANENKELIKLDNETLTRIDTNTFLLCDRLQVNCREK